MFKRKSWSITKTKVFQLFKKTISKSFIWNRNMLYMWTFPHHYVRYSSEVVVPEIHCELFRYLTTKNRWFPLHCCHHCSCVSFNRGRQFITVQPRPFSRVLKNLSELNWKLIWGDLKEISSKLRHFHPKQEQPDPTLTTPSEDQSLYYSNY